jgi:hypothetical protein
MKSISVWQNLSVAAATVLMSLSVGTAAQSITLTNQTTGNQYFLTTARSSWTDAQAEAVAAGGNLVTINDAEEQKWLIDVFGSSELFWIGLTDEQTEGVWKWSSGDNVSFTYWSRNEPNNALSYADQYFGGENYVVMNWLTNGKWNDVANTFVSSRGIVEIVKDSIDKIPKIFEHKNERACPQ